MARIAVAQDWWRHLFDELYLVTDARSVCDHALTCREVDFLESHLDMEKRDHILDLCGGHGRHSLELARRGYGRLTVLDYSGCLLDHGNRRAREEGLKTRFVRADARSTGLGDGRFDRVLMMANSFGYFPDDRDNLLVMREAHRVCRPGGTLLMDLLDSDSVVRDFRPCSLHQATEDLAVHRERVLENGLICVRERVISAQKGLVREASYCEHLYGEAELRDMLQEAGFIDMDFRRDFTSHDKPGDYGFMTRRVILTARRPELC